VEWLIAPLLLQGSQSPDARILQAVGVDIDALVSRCPQLVEQSDTIEWDEAQGTLKALRRTQIGRLTLSVKPLAKPSEEELHLAMLNGIRDNRVRQAGFGVSLEGNYTSLSNLGAGRLLADDRITLNGTTLTNEGQIAANSLQLTGNSLQNAGLIQGDNGLTLNVVDTTNSGTLQSGGALDLRGNTLTNSGELSATELLLNLTQQVNNDASGRAIARDGLTLTTAVLRNSGLLAGKNTQLNSDAITNSGTLQGTATLTAIGKQLSNLQAGMMLAGGGLDLQNATLNNAGLLQGKTLNLATGEWINSGNALGEAGVTAKVAGTLTNQGKVLSQQTLDVDAGSLDNRGQLLAKVLTLHGDLQNSGLLQGSSDVRWRGNSFTNQALGQVTGGETLSLTGKSLINQGQIQAQRATLSADNLTNGGAVQTLDNLTLTLTGKVDNQGALLSQNLFDLTAAQLFNAGQLAGKALSLSAPDITNNGLQFGDPCVLRSGHAARVVPVLNPWLQLKPRHRTEAVVELTVHRVTRHRVIRGIVVV
jgi:filamentous hemagglutinin